MDNSNNITIDRLRNLEPLSNLSDERLEELISLSYAEKLPIGVSIFREGEIDNQTIYLLEGDVQLTSSDNKTDKVITSRQEEAKYPIDDSQPRQVSGIALARIEIFRIDNSVLDYMMMWDQMAVSEENNPEPEPMEFPLEAEAKPPQPEQQEKTASEAPVEQEKKEEAAEDSETKGEPKPELKAEVKQEEPKPEPEDKSAAEEPKVEAKVEKEPEAEKPEQAAEPATENKQAETKKPTEAKEDNTKPTVAVGDNPPPVPDVVTQGDEDKSWIRKMRHIMAFKNMPPANIKALLEKMETIIVKENEVVVQQGDEGDYYYVLTEGEAKVTRMVELAELSPGASFGEEALVSDNTRNASVTMKSNGMLMRLSKQNFNALLKEPMLSRVSPDEARSIVNNGGVWLDVRHAKEYSYSRLPKAINIPLHEVRIRLEELAKDKHYVCYCTTGRRSSAAAFLLAQRGFKVSVLNGGVQVMAQDLVK